MVEQPYACECHSDAVLVASHDDVVVADAAACLGNILYTALVGTLHVVAEGEEGIAAKTDASVLGYPGLLLLAAEGFGLLRKELLPFALCKDIHVVVADIDVNRIVAVCTANTWDEGQRHHLGILAEPPDVGLAASQTRAMDTALLTSSDADGLTVLDVADAVALRIFEGDEGNDKVATGSLREILVDGRDVLEESWVVQLHFISSLLESYAKHLFAFNRSRNIVRVNLNDIVGPLAFFAKNLQGFLRIAGSNDAVAHLALDDEGSRLVASITQGNEVTIAAHTVGTTGAGVGTGNRTEGHLDVIHKIDAGQSLAQRQTDSSSCRGDVLETGCCRKTCSGFQFLHQLPAVQRVKEVDVARPSTEYFNRKFALFHIYTGRFLIGIAPVFELQFFLCHILL